MRRLVVLALVPLLASQSGCGVIFQTIYGWNDQVEREATRTYPIAVASEPPGALVTRLDPGAPIELGPSPAQDVVPVPVHEVVEIPKSTVPMFVGALVDVVITLAALQGIASAADDPLGREGEVAGYFYLMIGAASGAFADLIFAAIYANAEPKVVKMTPLLDERPTSYLAVKGGYKSMMSTIRVPWQTSVKLELIAQDTAPIERALPSLEPLEPGSARTSSVVP